MNRKEKLLLSLLAVGILGSLAGLGVFGAFSSTTTNPGNAFSAGTVTLADNDSNVALYSLSNQKPGEGATRCIKVTYTGSLPAEVRLYTSSAIGTLGQYVDLVITPGTGTNADCSDFAVDGAAGTPFSGTLASFATAHGSFANGLEFNPLGATRWVQNDTLTYRFQVTLQDQAAAQGLTTGTHAFEWQAQNQ